jgi:hypothetical protein
MQENIIIVDGIESEVSSTKLRFVINFFPVKDPR